MAATWLGGTGFEMGTIPVISANYWIGYGATLSIVTSPVKTGTYSLYTCGNRGPMSGAPDSAVWIRWSVTGTPTKLYVGAWVYPATSEETPYQAVQAYLATGHIVEVRLTMDDGLWRAYVDGSLVATGTIAVVTSSWHNIQVMFDIANSGAIQTMVNGTVDIDYSGDTMPGASGAISYVRLYQNGGDSVSINYPSYWDNLCWCTDDWPGDIRFDYLLPNTDSSIQWSQYPVGTGYTTIDERPAGDTDYIYTEAAEMVNKHGLQDWGGSSKTPQFLNIWARAKKITASVRGIKVGVESNGSTSTSGSLALTTDYVYYNHVAPLDPDGDVAWTDAKIDAALLRLESS